MSNGAMRNKFNPTRSQGRTSFDRINIRSVPPSRHAVFFRGFPSDIDINKLKDYLEDDTQSNVGVDFSRVNEAKKLCIAFRFESHEIARQVLNKYNNVDCMGHPVDCTWFKDLKKARDRMIDEKRHLDDRFRGRYDYDRNDYPSDRRRPQIHSHHDNSIDRRESSFKNARPSDHDERSPSRSSDRSKSNSVLEKLKSTQEIKYQKNVVKPVTYGVDLDDEEEEEDDEVVEIKPIPQKIPKENIEVIRHIKHDGEDKKKKKKKRKRRKHETSESDESIEPPPKSGKILLDDPETIIKPIKANVTSWKQPVSDSDDYVDNSNQISKSKSFVHIYDKLNNEKNLKIMKQKMDDIEKAYKHDSETYSTVVNVLVRKAPDLKMRLVSVLREVLVDLGSQCMETMRDSLLELSEQPTKFNRDVIHRKPKPLLSLDLCQSPNNSSD